MKIGMSFKIILFLFGIMLQVFSLSKICTDSKKSFPKYFMFLLFSEKKSRANFITKVKQIIWKIIEEFSFADDTKKQNK